MIIFIDLGNIRKITQNDFQNPKFFVPDQALELLVLQTFLSCLKLLNPTLARTYNLNKSSINREPFDLFKVIHEDIKSTSVLQVEYNAFFQQVKLECLHRFDFAIKVDLTNLT